jgi:integrase
MAERISVWSYQTSKTKRWAFEVRFPKEKRKLQRRGFMSQSEALRTAKQLRMDGRPTAINPSVHLTVSSLCFEYLESLKGAVREHTRANYADILLRYVLPVIGNKCVSEVSEPDVSLLLAGLRARGLKAGTVNTVRARTIGLFSYAFRRRLIEVNPASLTRVQQKFSESDTAVQAPLSAEEAINLLQASIGTPIEIFLSLCLGLGLRKGEALGLRWSDIDFEIGEVIIRRSRGQSRLVSQQGKRTSVEVDGEVKTRGSVRRLPINITVMSALQATMKNRMPRSDDYVVSAGDGRPLSLSVLHRKYSQIFRVNNLRYVRIHDLRHTAAVLALENLAPLEAVSQALGHSGVEITKRIYAPKVRALDEVFAKAIDSSLLSGFESANEVVYLNVN